MPPKNLGLIHHYIPASDGDVADTLLLLRPGILQAAALFHPMVPVVPDTLPDLTGTCVFVGAGRQDPIVSPQETDNLAALLRQSGADVTLHWQPGGHGLSREEAQAAAQWLAARPPS